MTDSSGKETSPDDSTNDDLEHAMTTLVFPESHEDRECRLLLDSSEYYNQYMVPGIVPAHLPFRRCDLLATHWTLAPPIIRNLLILIVKSSQAKRAGGGGGLSTEICIYRGHSLKCLKESLTDAAKEPYGIALAGILTLMGIDILHPDFGRWSWTYHFRAARQIINLRGGFAKCFFSLPLSQDLLTRYMVLDVFSATTCCTTELELESVKMQARYSPITMLRERSMLEKGSACPQPLLQAIIQTNILRWKQQARDPWRLESSHVRPYAELVSDISSFDSSSWATRIARYGLVQPLSPNDVPTSALSHAWYALACCYKQAAMLYCTLSLRAPTYKDDNQEVLDIQNSLARNLDVLFCLATSDLDGALETQLWKFCIWPAVISIYVRICWCCSDFQEMTRELAEMHATAKTLGNSLLMRCWTVMSTIAATRSERLHAGWKWSDGFPSRRVFVAC